MEAKGGCKIKAWIDKREYISPEIVNKMIKLMGKAIHDEVLAEIKGLRWYSLSIRWVNDFYQIFEDTLALAELPNTKSITIY